MTKIERQDVTPGGRQCLLYRCGERPRVVLVQPLGVQGHNSIDDVAAAIEADSPVPFVLAAPIVKQWESELMPWRDPVMSRKMAAEPQPDVTLRYLTHTLLPWLGREFGDLPVVLGGYSLGGLFALWAAHESDRFAAIAAVSPSLWITGWDEFARARQVKAGTVYLSLGLDEERTRNRTFARVGDCVRREHALLQEQVGRDRCTLEWNRGDHFDDNARRTARGFVWCIGRCFSCMIE